MISIEKALNIIITSVIPRIKIEDITLDRADGRFLAADITVDRDLPPFNRVAVDGYACKKADLSNELEIIETVPAGSRPKKEILAGQCSKVMTGCPLPSGAELVFMVEDSQTYANGKVKFIGIEKQVRFGNFSLKGEEVKSGTTIFSAGKQITINDIGTLALAGAYNLQVRPTLKIGVIATGDELVEPWQTPADYQIRNANSCQLLAQIKKSGQESKYYGVVKDEPSELAKVFSQAVDECDLVLLTGGVSAGDFDFVPQIMQEQGFKILFNKVAIKPGKPTTFTVRDNKFVFGLPGNPVSAFVIFEVFVKPLIFALQGGLHQSVEAKMNLAADFSRRNAERCEFVPVYFNNGLLFPVKYHGSGHLQALTLTQGFMIVEAGITEIVKGSEVVVRFV